MIISFTVVLISTNLYFREQLQNARENPLAAAAVTGGASTQAPTNIENLLDIDFDGAAPASAQNEPSGGISGLDGLAGTPVRSQTPVGGIGSSSGVLAARVTTSATSNNLDDLLGVFGNGGDSAAVGPGDFVGGNDDLMNGFAGLDLSSGGNSQSSAPKKTNEDIMSLF